MKKLISRTTWEVEDRNHYAYTNQDGRFVEETGEDGQDHLVAVLIVEDVQAIFDLLSESEKAGIGAGLIPERIREQMQERMVFPEDLMQFDAYIRSCQLCE